MVVPNATAKVSSIVTTRTNSMRRVLDQIMVVKQKPREF
jgi:hypothetical protein